MLFPLAKEGRFDGGRDSSSGHSETLTLVGGEFDLVATVTDESHIAPLEPMDGLPFHAAIQDKFRRVSNRACALAGTRWGVPPHPFGSLARSSSAFASVSSLCHASAFSAATRRIRQPSLMLARTG